MFLAYPFGKKLRDYSLSPFFNILKVGFNWLFRSRKIFLWSELSAVWSVDGLFCSYGGDYSRTLWHYSHWGAAFIDPFLCLSSPRQSAWSQSLKPWRVLWFVAFFGRREQICSNEMSAIIIIVMLGLAGEMKDYFIGYEDFSGTFFGVGVEVRLAFRYFRMWLY